MIFNDVEIATPDRFEIRGGRIIAHFFAKEGINQYDEEFDYGADTDWQLLDALREAGVRPTHCYAVRGINSRYLERNGVPQLFMTRGQAESMAMIYGGKVHLVEALADGNINIVDID